MATIHSLNRSISAMPRQALHDLLQRIRAQRRLRPERKLREKTAPAKVARAPKKSALKPNDVFAFAKGLTEAQKAALALELMKGMKL